MRKIFMFIILFSFSFSQGDDINAIEVAQISNDNSSNGKLVAARKRATKKSRKRKRSKSRASRSSRSKSKTSSSSTPNELKEALQLAKQGNYLLASEKLFSISNNPTFRDKKMQTKYILGLMLFELKLYQVAAFQFVEIVRNGNNKYVKKSLEKLSIAANYLDNDTLLNYALSKIKLADFPSEQHDMLFFRIGEILYRKQLHSEATSHFRKVSPKSEWYSKAKYMEGLSFAESGKLKSAARAFQTLVDSREGKDVTDKNKVAGLMGLARVYYQQKKWALASEMYRKIPRDTEFWHNTLFELSWASMRSAQFRSVLSTLHSLHSPYYEDYYNPESVLLRSIVYLYLCQYEEMEKTLDFFEKTYVPIHKSLRLFLRDYRNTEDYYKEIADINRNFVDLKENPKKRNKLKIPFLVARTILRENDVERSMSYIGHLENELRVLANQPTTWKSGGIGRYTEKILSSRLTSAKKVVGKEIRAHMIKMRRELATLFEQNGFARYEMINGKKEALKKRIVSKSLEKRKIDDDVDRSFYVQGGYEYWPFNGEYWLDEIGNYHYVGVQRCE